MPTVSINLPPDLNLLVERKVVCGQFHSAEAVLCEGLRLLQEREELGKPDCEVSTLEELEAKLLVGLEQLERGEGIRGEQVFAELEEHSRRRRAHA